MQQSWLVLLPPVLVLIFAFISRNLNLSLLVGLGFASLIAMDGNPLTATLHALKRLLLYMADADSIFLYIFLIIISMLVVLLDRTGGARAFAQLLTKKLRNARATQTSAILMSTSLFIDDYLSTLTVGHVMRPLTDQFKIPRVKLAFIIHTLAGPLVVLSPVSTWVGVLTSQLDQAGVSSDAARATTKIITDPFSAFVQSIPFIFYSLIMIACLWFIVLRRISFGPMHRQEEIADSTGNLFGGKDSIKAVVESKAPEGAGGTMLDLILPLATLIISIICGMLYTGGYYCFGGDCSFVQALQHTSNTSLVLVVAGILAMTVGFARGMFDGHIKLSMFPSMLYDSVLLIYGAIIMLTLVSTLGIILKTDLLTGEYLATTLQGSFSISLLPCIFFIVAAITSIMIGSSWGTIALLVPIAVPMLTAFSQQQLPIESYQLPLLFPLLGAIFGGAVCGDHISPMSQTTIMAATSSGCYPLDHVQTQLPYALPTIFASIIAFLIAGYLTPYGLGLASVCSLSVGIVVALGALTLLNALQRRKRKQ